MSDFQWSLEPGYRIEVFAEQDVVTPDDVLALWTSEGGLPPEEAERRLSELLVVACDDRGRLAGICTAYLARTEQLGADMWHSRVLVAAAHRQSNVARAVAVAGRDHLERRFLSGEDRRGLGVIYVVQTQVLRDHAYACWRATRAWFIGETARGDHVRVHYFPGALAPERITA
jgi:hypothetical protein